MRFRINFYQVCVFFALLGGVNGANAQDNQHEDNAAYHKAVINATFDRIEKYHFAPRPMDSVYSRRVWLDFLFQLDPSRSIFLASDIQRLTKFKLNLGKELSNGSLTFFDSAYSLYYARLEQLSVFCEELLRKSFDLSQKETIQIFRKEAPYPKTAAEQQDLWRKKIKYSLLTQYMSADTLPKNKQLQGISIDSNLMEKSYDYVRKLYGNYFRNELAATGKEYKFATYVSCAVGEIDPHTAYMAPKDRILVEALTKQYFGIGIELGTKDLDFYVKRLLQGGPAYKSGEIKQNDQILAIGDENGNMQQVSGMVANQVASLIRGENGTVVTLELEQPGHQSRIVKLKRGEIVESQNRAKSAIINKEGKTFGYIYLPMFYMDPKGNGQLGAANDVVREVAKLKENGVDGIVMDLRSNGGGSLDEAVKMCGSFIPGGAVSWLRGKQKVDRYSTSKSAVFYDGPMTVLVNESSASASEIFAAAMQDYQRAIIIGTTSTFGKGTAQQNLNMGKLGDAEKGIPDTSYGSMRLTIDKFYRVTGISTQLAGVKSDIVLQDKMSLESQTEKKYLSALLPDTLKLDSFKKLEWPFCFDKIVTNENNRLKNNEVFKSVVRNREHLENFKVKPLGLDFASFKDEYLHKKQLEQSLSDALQLNKQDKLDIQPAYFLRLKPGTIKEDPIVAEQYRTWLETLSKDIYLNETINVLLDMSNDSK